MRWLVVVWIVTASSAWADEPISDEDWLKQHGGEAIEIYDERPDKPFDRDTEVRLTGEELAARGAFDLKSALALLPDVNVREAGRGGFQVDIRGARKGEVTILIDGVPVSDPYYGNFDVTTIPITDIVQIRIATTPQSPIDGPGGPGGVIEVHTRDAIGPQLVVARMASDTLPTVGVTGTARVALAEHLALRLSGGGTAGSRDLPLPTGYIDERRHAASGAARLEYRRGDRRVVVDSFLDDRHYVQPPSDEEPGPVLLIDRQLTSSTSVKVDEKRGKLQLQAQGWAAYLKRWSRNYTDPSMVTETNVEKLRAFRVGGALLATRSMWKDARWAASASFVREQATVDNSTNTSKGAVTIAELAGDVQYERKRFRVDGAVGVALPFGVGASPWLEAKLVAKYKPMQQLELTATGGRKGRLPSLRERFDAFVGNPALGPEIADHAELRAVADVAKRTRIEVAPFYRHSTGTIRAVAGMMGSKLTNTGRLDIYGVDTIGRVTLSKLIEVGAGYSFVRAKSDTDDEPLDFLPHHRAEGSLRLTPKPGYVGMARVRYVSSAIDRTETIPAYVLVEASFSAQLTREYAALLRVDDLLDKRPEVRAGYHGPGRVLSVIVQGSWD